MVVSRIFRTFCDKSFIWSYTFPCHPHGERFFIGLIGCQQLVKGRLKPAILRKGRFAINHKYSPIPTIAGFKEIPYGESTQNGYGNIDIKTAPLVSSTYRPRAWNQP